MATNKKTIAAVADDPVLVAVRALTPIRHDGVDYAEQEVFELTQADATALVASGCAVLARTDPAELSLA